MLIKQKSQIKDPECNKSLKNIAILILIILIGNIVFQIALSNGARAQDMNPEDKYYENCSYPRSVNSYTIDKAMLTGTFLDDKAHFNLTYILNIEGFENNTLNIPLIGPPEKARVVDLTIDGNIAKVYFKNEYYYSSNNFSNGKHKLVFRFSSSKLDIEIKKINYTLYGPVLNYKIEFKIPVAAGKEVFILDYGQGSVSKSDKQMNLNWEYFALEETIWSFSWLDYLPVKKDDIRCTMESVVFVDEKKAILEVTYMIDFFGFALDEISFELNEFTSIKSVDMGKIKSGALKTKIRFNELIKNELLLKVTFEIWIINELVLTIPQPFNCMFTGEVAIFSDSNIAIYLIENENSMLTGYSGKTKAEYNFIGNYYFTEQSKLKFNVTPKETSITAEIIDTLTTTFEGYELETWILFNFFGSSPSSITIELPSVSEKSYSPIPEFLIDLNIPLPLLDYNWDGNLNMLTLWLKENISGEYLFGLKRNSIGNDVTMEDLSISDAKIIDYFVIYYLEKGVQYESLFNSGLSTVNYDEISQRLRDQMHPGSNLEIFRAERNFMAILNIKKATDMTCEIFFRNWVSDSEIAIHQIFRVMSESVLNNNFIFSIPVNALSLDVQGCAAWTIMDGRLVVYTEKSYLNILLIYIDAKIANSSGEVVPFMPIGVEDCKIYSMFGSASNLNLTLTTYNAEIMNPDELPKHFLTEINTPKAVKVYYSSKEPSFSVVTNKYITEETPTTVIELAQITIITSLDGKNAIQALFMIKNVDSLEMHVTLPKGVKVWMVLVGGKTVPIIQNNNVLTLTLIRSTLTGENIAYPVEIVYMLTEPMDRLEFILPEVDVPILNFKINIGLPSSFNIKDPEKFNPNFEFEGRDVWKSGKNIIESDPNYISNYEREMHSQLTKISYDKDSNEPDLVYIGLDDFDGDSDNIKIEKIDTSGDNYNFTYNVNEQNSQINPVNNIVFTKISLSQGQYIISNDETQRQISVFGGNTQQIIFDSENEMVFTDVPPIYLQLPQSGQVFRFSAIFIKPHEERDILLVESEVKDTGEAKGFYSTIMELNSFLIILIIIIILLCLLGYKKLKKGKKGETGKKIKPKLRKTKMMKNKLNIKDQEKKYGKTL